MQRTEAEGIVISCDFCHRDWDGAEPMIEGHHGSIICLPCLQLALDHAATSEDKYQCTLCLRFNIPGTVRHWSHPDAPITATADRPAPPPQAIVCGECITQAAKAFSKSPLTPWTLPPTVH